MRPLRVVGIGVLLVFLCMARPGASRADPRAGRERLDAAASLARGGAQGAAPAARVRDPARGGGTRDPQAAQHRLRRPGPALGDRHARIPVPEAAGHPGPRHGQDPLRLPPRRPGRQDPDVRRRPEHPDRPAPLSLGPRGGRAQHPQRLPDARHRRRRPRRQSRGALRGHRPPRHPRHDQRLLLGLRRLDLRLPRLRQQLEGPGEGSPPDRDAIGQYLPDAARRLARRVRHPRPGQPVRPGVRPAGQPLLVRLPQPAGLPAPAGRLVPQLRQAGRRPGVRPRHGHPRPRLDRDRRHQLLRRRPVPRGVSRHGLHRQRRHQPDQPRPDRVARLDAQRYRAARLRLERGQLVPAGGHRAGPRRGALHRRLLQPDHRPLRGRADPPGPRPLERTDLADRLPRDRRQGATSALVD